MCVTKLFLGYHSCLFILGRELMIDQSTDIIQVQFSEPMSFYRNLSKGLLTGAKMTQRELHHQRPSHFLLSICSFGQFSFGTISSQESPLFETVINKRCTIAYDHWVGQHPPKPLLLLLPVICTLTAVPIAHVRAHTGMHTLHYSHISKTTLVQTRLKVPQPLQFPSCLLPLVLFYLQPPTLCFAFHAASERKKNLIISDLEAFNALPYYMSCPLPACYSITREFGVWFTCQR